MGKVQPSHTRQRKTEYIDQKEIPAFGSKRKEVTLGIEKAIGKGAFGQVAKGTAMYLRERPGISAVAVKMLKGNPKVIQSNVCGWQCYLRLGD